MKDHQIETYLIVPGDTYRQVSEVVLCDIPRGEEQVGNVVLFGKLVEMNILCIEVLKYFTAHTEQKLKV